MKIPAKPPRKLPKRSVLPASFVLIAVSTLIIDIQMGQAQEERPAATGSLPLYPLDVAVADDGVAYVVDRNLPGVWQWKDGELAVFFQASKKYRTPLNAPRCIAIAADGTVLVGDSATRDVYRLSSDGQATPITGGKIGIPMDLAVAEDGTIWVADLELRYLMRIPPGSSEVERVASVNPRGVGLDSTGRVWVVSQDNAQLLRVSSDGEVEKIVDQRTFEFPHQVAIDDSGIAYVTDGYKKAVWKIPVEGPPEVLVEGQPLDNPVGLTLAKDRLVLVDPRARTVFELSLSGELKKWFEIKRP